MPAIANFSWRSELYVIFSPSQRGPSAGVLAGLMKLDFGAGV